MPPKGGIIAALDIGSTKISCLIAEAVPAKHRSSEGEDKQQPAGSWASDTSCRAAIRSGSIVNVDEAERAIRLAVDAAERMAQRTITEVYVNVSGGRPQSRLYTGAEKPQTGPGGARAIMDRVLERRPGAGRSRPPQRSCIWRRCSISSTTRGASRIAGRHVRRDAVARSRRRHRRDAASQEPGARRRARPSLGRRLRRWRPMRRRSAVLADDEKTLGVTLVDMGGATTELRHLPRRPSGDRRHRADGRPAHHQRHRARAFHHHCPCRAHEDAVGLCPCVAGRRARDDSVPLLGERGVDTVQQVPKSMLTGIIRPRLEEIFELLRDKLEASGVAHLAGRRVVLTGGASQLTGVREVAAQWLDRQVRMGLPGHVQGMPESAHSPGFAVCAGLLQLCAEAGHPLCLAQGQGRGGRARPAGLCPAHGPLDRRKLLRTRDTAAGLKPGTQDAAATSGMPPFPLGQSVLGKSAATLPHRNDSI